MLPNSAVLDMIKNRNLLALSKRLFHARKAKISQVKCNMALSVSESFVQRMSSVQLHRKDTLNIQSRVNFTTR